ncbi:MULTISPECIES: prephenate dehydrogenase/arogenate dehydrogenase family protein [unclassified Halanaerobium]|uniref:prephenate dehydrogenase n=1 Tax=unclassified Halanaerobium TaxID=2641197 RepID=UPI000DF1492B|nr:MULTISPECIES: prephenate dehydrogenase/arogenate dehydrogenase family protein [unclassified Halanaerobium]RCW48290.1 prephenate dehydrogenase [Halanaerobium sp. MA284_MarDTE_T2]RCW85717.1 prephenate dehydrogenase [Halanaerobium sp. DL-01]
MKEFRETAVLGVGLIGGSLAAAFRKKSISEKIIGIDIDEENLLRAKKMNIIDEGYTEIGSNLNNSDLIILAAPIFNILGILDKLPYSKETRQIIIDTGSTKKEILKKAENKFSGQENRFFIGGHPMAGSEKSGVKFADPELFVEAPFILTPAADTDRKIVEKIKNVLKKIGCRVYIIDAEEHDRCAAVLSHLPHLVSAVLLNTACSEREKEKLYRLAGSGFYDMTRIAGGSPELWQDIFWTNRDNLEDVLGKYIKNLENIKEKLSKNDKNGVFEILKQGAENKIFVSREGKD